MHNSNQVLSITYLWYITSILRFTVVIYNYVSVCVGGGTGCYVHVSGGQKRQLDSVEVVSCHVAAGN